MCDRSCPDLTIRRDEKVTRLEVYQFVCNKLEKIVWLGSKDAKGITPCDCPRIEKPKE